MSEDEAFTKIEKLKVQNVEFLQVLLRGYVAALE